MMIEEAQNIIKKIYITVMDLLLTNTKKREEEVLKNGDQRTATDIEPHKVMEELVEPSPIITSNNLESSLSM